MDKKSRPVIIIREDGRVEQVCEHGVGHPIGHVREWDESWMGVHGCCGEHCCQDYPMPQSFLKVRER
jgi:hypothetical protein